MAAIITRRRGSPRALHALPRMGFTCHPSHPAASATLPKALRPRRDMTTVGGVANLSAVPTLVSPNSCADCALRVTPAQ